MSRQQGLVPPPNLILPITHSAKASRPKRLRSSQLKDLAPGAKVSLRPALPFPRLLLLLPDNVHTPRNTSAISL